MVPRAKVMQRRLWLCRVKAELPTKSRILVLRKAETVNDGVKSWLKSWLTELSDFAKLADYLKKGSQSQSAMVKWWPR